MNIIFLWIWIILFCSLIFPLMLGKKKKQKQINFYLWAGWGPFKFVFVFFSRNMKNKRRGSILFLYFVRFTLLYFSLLSHYITKHKMELSPQNRLFNFLGGLTLYMVSSKCLALDAQPNSSLPISMEQTIKCFFL